MFVAAGPDAVADAQGDLEKAHSAYVAHKYDDAESRLRALLDAKTGALKDADSINDARMYLGAVLLAEGKKDEAARTFDQLLRERPDYQPDPLRVSLDAIDAFIDTRTRIRDQLAAIQAEQVRKTQEERAKVEAERQKAAARLTTLEKLASTEVVVERHSRWLALIPFGVGQFQNGQDTLGWLFLTGEGLLAGATAVSAGLSLYYSGQASTLFGHGDPNAGVFQTAAQRAAITADVLEGALAAMAVAGIVHAQLTFVPEHIELRKRDVPSVSLSPILAPGFLGLRGTF
jgi:tetratricopeptide (TPR) repeat protein